MATPIDAHVGQRLTYLRRLRKMSQSALGDLLGITYQQVQKCEQGTNRISASRLYEAAGVLDVPVRAFFDGVDLSLKGNTLNELPVPSADLLGLLQAFVAIENTAVRRAVIDMVTELAGPGPGRNIDAGQHDSNVTTLFPGTD